MKHVPKANGVSLRLGLCAGDVQSHFTAMDMNAFYEKIEDVKTGDVEPLRSLGDWFSGEV